MCRWFAYISPSEKCLLEDVLILPDHAISKQVDDHYLPGLWPWETEDTSDDNEEGKQNVFDRNFMNNSDGLGVVWYSTTRTKFTDPTNIFPLPTLYKTLSNPPTDPNFISICATTATNALFAHIRAASAGMPVNEANCHPFVFGRFTFMHNGAVGDFQGVKKMVVNRLSDEAYAKIMGTTDSEHLAGLFFTILAELSEDAGGPAGPAAWSARHPVSRFVKAFDTLLTTIMNFQRTLASRLKVAPTPGSLNMCATDGEQLVAARFRSHKIQQPPSLYWTDEAGVVLNRKFEGAPTTNVVDLTRAFSANASIGEHASATVNDVKYGTTDRSVDDHGSHLIVASEPTTKIKEDSAKWHIVPKNSYVVFGEETEDKVEIKPVGFDWEKELGLKD